MSIVYAIDEKTNTILASSYAEDAFEILQKKQRMKKQFPKAIFVIRKV